MPEPMWPEAPEAKYRSEHIAEVIDVLNETYAVLAVDRDFEMTEDEYRKMKDIQNRIPDLDGEDTILLGEELILANCQLSHLVNESLQEMEAYLQEHSQWQDMMS